MIKNQAKLALLLTLSSTFIILFSCDGPKPDINERFPVKESGQLSPPIVSKEIHECAEAVHVTGFVPHATVTVYANTSEVIAEEQPVFGYADIHLKRPLKLGESITATQKVGTVTSAQTIIPVIVTAYAPGGFPKPNVSPDLYECGLIVPVGNLVQSTKVHVQEEAVETGVGDAATDWLPVWTAALHAGKKVTAVQTACETDAGKTITSPVSDAVTVKAAPDPVPVPGCDKNTLIPGNDAVPLTGLLTGANVTVTDNGVTIGNGYATADANWVPLTQKLTASSHISAFQELCGIKSQPSPPVTPAGKLEAPLVLAPICAGSRFAIIRNTTVNANVVLLRNGAIAGYAGAVNGDLIIALGGTATFAAGDQVAALQTTGSMISPSSPVVHVQARLESPSLEIVDGEPFFLPENGEQAIEGPVFPRGRGNGPRFLVQACCEKKVKVTVTGPDGSVIANPDATDLFPGYYSATWNWHSFSNWGVPGGIPVGEYKVTVHSECAPQDVTKKFYVIFNPGDVGGPQRFSYDETGIWFGALTNQTRAIVYYLHPDDKRVFERAVKAASGQTDPLVAAGLVARAEEALFKYSLNYNSNDVVDMIENHDEAQCADDANCLSAMLRSVGIPAHPATADADIESGNINWTFDTWTEFLVPGSSGPQWLIFHPHEFPGMSPESRSVFGSTRKVAFKSTNDIVVMAGENWIWSEVSDGISDVSFSRPDCSEPQQNLSKKSWINELCEQGYWNPNHWDCAGLGTSSSGLGVSSINVNLGDAGYGRTISGFITYINRSSHRMTATPEVTIAGDLIESKKFPDTIYSRAALAVSLAPGDSTRIPFSLKLPETIVPGQSLVLQTGFEKRTLALFPFTLSNSFETKLDLPDTLYPGHPLRITATVSNISKQVVRNVTLDLKVPYAIEVTRGDIPQMISLQPGESRSFSWSGRVPGPLEAGTIRLQVGSANGGATEIFKPVQVQSANKTVESTVLQKKKNK